MVKKLQKMAEKKAASPAGLLDSQLAQTVKDSAQQIWLAGLGAFSKAQGEGTKVFETLMKEGASLHRKTQAAAEEKLGDVAGKMSAMAGGVGQKANVQWDKLESIFEERTARAMSKLGVPTAKDVAALADRVDALAAAVAALGKGAAADKPVAKARPAARKTAKPAKAAEPIAAAVDAPVEAKPAAKPAAKRAAKSAAQPAAKARTPRKAATAG
ncbi:phasin family protein [Ideonella sp. A 288]|uniref:phasin family protein n=1 Tax=Ideonella sp. A 288 TaxID=1962181 RepID=UPI000B4C1B2C|nr:phasin family protein [Ideonella sp. A 288]